MATMPAKEKFKDIIVTLLQTKNHNCISLSDTQYAEIVKTLKRVKTTGPKSCKDYYRKNRFALTLINGEERLTKSGTNLEFVSTDDLFDVIHQAHIFTNHGRRNTMVKLLATKYANITQEQVMVYLKMCEQCRMNHKSKIWKGFNLNLGRSPVPRHVKIYIGLNLLKSVWYKRTSPPMMAYSHEFGIGPCEKENSISSK